MAKRSELPEYLKPPNCDEHDARALKALETGTASEGQQKIALAFIINKVCGTYDLSHRPGPDGGRATDFCEGRRFVGTQLVAILKRPVPTKQGTTNG